MQIEHTYEWTFEKDKAVRKLQKHMHTVKKAAGNVLKCDVGKLAPVDALFAGFPCQPFSQGGSQEGVNDKRGTLVFTILNILAMQSPRPRLVLLENVVGILRHKRLVNEIVRLLSIMGYTVGVWVLNSLQSAVPQNRARVWIFGLLTEAMVRTCVVCLIPSAICWAEYMILVNRLRRAARASVVEAGLEASTQGSRVTQCASYFKGRVNAFRTTSQTHTV